MKSCILLRRQRSHGRDSTTCNAYTSSHLVVKGAHSALFRGKYECAVVCFLSASTNWPMTLSLLGVKQCKYLADGAESQVETRSSGLSSMFSRSCSSLQLQTVIPALPVIEERVIEERFIEEPVIEQKVLTSSATSIPETKKPCDSIVQPASTPPLSSRMSFAFRLIIALLVSLLVTGINTMGQRIAAYTTTKVISLNEVA